MRHGRTRSRPISARCASSSWPTATTPTTRRSARLFGPTSVGATPTPATRGSSKPNAATAPGSAASNNADGATHAMPHSARTFVVRALAAQGSLLEAFHQFVVLLRVEVAVAVEHDDDGGMAGEGGDSLGVRSVGDPEGDGSVAQVVDAQWGEFGRSDGGRPEAAAEQGGADRARLGGAENERVGRYSGRSKCGELVGDEPG